MKDVQRKKTKGQTGKTFNQSKLHLSCFFNLIPCVCTVQINSMRHVPLDSPHVFYL